MFFKIAITRSEKRQVMEFWEEIIKESQKIKDDYDKVNDDRFHQKFYEKMTINYYIKHENTVRPEFIEPLPKK